ncbi:glutamate synthase large subunit [Marinoscillum sp. MHG1-6]|uniref:glutamate synthase large subunit n=1 Tax=Marinoscillum sp. MHG1-6 TaxID=2959627 RepID=UPI002157D551|nr:glutamate synthase large subunit [Marinoscillum sp. MHG1-6]
MQKKTLYRKEFEHDSCGVGCVANLSNKPDHNVVKDALSMLCCMEHRGGTGSDPDSGDGAGILTQIPHSFFKEELSKFAINLPKRGTYGVGMLFLPKNYQLREKCRSILNECISNLGLSLIGYRLVPVDELVPGHESKAVEPYVEQVFVGANDEMSQDELERKLFVLSNYASHEVEHNVKGENGDFYVCSFSSKKIIYKGQLRTDQVGRYYHDLRNEKYVSTFAIVHSRFSTNTFPNWKLAQPFRYLAHNGEINTIRGNVNKMKSKEATMSSKYFTDEELQWLLPVTDIKNSDSANLDALVELLYLGGRKLPHVMMMLVPEAWQDNKGMDAEKKAFYKYHSAIMEPWDGPAALFFTNGTELGATLDRNGLRPVRYCVTKDGRVIMASEVGALNLDPDNILENGRLQPGKMLWIDLPNNKLVKDDEIKRTVIESKPYFDWVKKERIKLKLLPTPDYTIEEVDDDTLLKQMKAYGYTQEDLKMTLEPMALQGKEPVGSMGSDSPLAVISRQSQHVANYFKQYFAQVSNPPIDPIRERLVMSLFTRVGEAQNILDETPEHTRQIHISQPVLSHAGYHKLMEQEDIGFGHHKIESVYDPSQVTLKEAINRVCKEAEEAVESGKCVIILSNRNVDEKHVPIPSLLATGAVHHYLVEKNLRTKSSLVIEAGDIWETHHFATIIGYGASAVYPFKVYDIIKSLQNEGVLDQSVKLGKYYDNFTNAVGQGLLKILSKMGISTLQSYQAAQIFECVGLGAEVVSKCFKGTVSRLDGLTFDDLEKEALIKHHAGYESDKKILEVGGFFQWKRNGEVHLLNPETIHLLQKSTSLNDYELWKKYSESVYNHQAKNSTLRSLFDFKARPSVPLEEVEPVENILKRFATGAMSFGSISYEAHSTLAIAMNRIGGKSNSGEGGEDEIRFEKKPNGDWERSAIKQIASGRFGVTSNYLKEADELQIKIAQGAKPGEGGQLPGHKVDDWIARVRHSTPGVGLISPPPHHDIYSIEDLAQLIYDLKNANRHARINVKLVSEAGVGTIASGVAKAKADVIMISGADGGTGASPISSIRHAGLPWEMGLSEAHQTLLRNNLRSRIVLQTDGKLMTGRDVAVATLLGAEEYGFATTALIVEGCIMMRKCHLNTCPVGIATQKPELRKLFTGNPDHVVNFFRFIAQELREIMAELGFKTVNEMVGQSEVLKVKSDLDHWKLKTIDFNPILNKEMVPDSFGVYNQIEQNHGLEHVLDTKIIEDYLVKEQNHKLYDIINTDRSVGAMFSHEISKKYGGKGLQLNKAKVGFKGYAGQSFGAFLAPGVEFELEGQANDYCGKGLSGGTLVIKVPEKTSFVPSENIIIGNVAFYGATSGKAYINGMAGERFCVRNSGVEAVVEGIGDHGCEYMTGGKVIILGETGNNFAAGMSGGIAYVIDEFDAFNDRLNGEMVSLEKLQAEDLIYVKEEIEKHIELTDSGRAKEILENWDKYQSKFVKVMPNDLKRVLEEKRLKEKVA